jgi:hypothetical protein
MNAAASFNGKSSRNDHIMPGTVSKNVSKGIGKVMGWVVAV